MGSGYGWAVGDDEGRQETAREGSGSRVMSHDGRMVHSEV